MKIFHTWLAVSKSFLALADLQDAGERLKFLKYIEAIEMWKKLGIAVDASKIPAISTALIKEFMRLTNLKQEPILVLDLGMSIQALDKIFLAATRSAVLFTGPPNPYINTAQDFYTEARNGYQWILLPGSDHGVLPGTRGISYDQQVQYMHDHYPDYEVGGVRERFIVEIYNYFKDERLFREVIFGMCKEECQIDDTDIIRMTQTGPYYIFYDYMLNYGRSVLSSRLEIQPKKYQLVLGRVKELLPTLAVEVIPVRGTKMAPYIGLFSLLRGDKPPTLNTNKSDEINKSDQ